MTVTAAVASVKWKESFATGKVTFSFTTTEGANLEASLRNAETKRLDSAKKFSVAEAGTYTRSMRVSARPVPGTYILRVEEVPTGGHGDFSLTIKAPPEGVVDRAYTSNTKNGPPAKVVRHAKIIYAHFHFVTPPQASTVRFIWRKPGNPKVRFTGEKTKPYAPTVDTYVCVKYSRTGTCLFSINQQLRPGKWYCILYAAGRVAKRQRVTVT